MQRCVVKIFILHGAARRQFHYALGHLLGGALNSVPDENTQRDRALQRLGGINGSPVPELVPLGT